MAMKPLFHKQEVHVSEGRDYLWWFEDWGSDGTLYKFHLIVGGNHYVWTMNHADLEEMQKAIQEVVEGPQ